MNSPALSFICASNDKNVLERMLLASLKKQNNQNYELIIVDAKERGFSSASEALNYGASIAKGRCLCFCHQDIEFLEEDAVDMIIHCFDSCEFAFGGVAGIASDPSGYKGYRIHSSVTQGDDHHQAGIAINGIEECVVVDECCMFCKKDAFKGFDDYGATWHFYGVEYSQRCQNEGGKVLLFPVSVYHLSTGSVNASFWDTLRKYAKRNKKNKVLVSCCGVWKNNWTLPILCFLHKYKKVEKLVRRIKHLFKREKEASNV